MNRYLCVAFIVTSAWMLTGDKQNISAPLSEIALVK